MPTAKQRVEAAERRLFARYGLDVATRYIELHDPHVEIRLLEAGDGPPLLLLHGAGEIASQWAPLMARLDGHRILALDLPGFGLSQLVDYSVADPREYGVATITALLDALDLPAASIAGNSLGGAWGLWLALDAPDRLRALALLGCPLFALRGAHLSASLAATAIRGLNRFILNLPVPPLRVNRFMYARTLGRHAVESAPPEIVEIAHHAMDRPTFAVAMSSLMERTFGLRRPRKDVALSDDELADIKHPVLLVWGTHDRFGSPRLARRFSRRIENCEMHFVDGGHNPWLDEPETCARLVGSFLDDLEG